MGNILGFIWSYSLVGSLFVGPICALILVIQWILSLRHRNRSVLYWRSTILLLWLGATYTYWNYFWLTPGRGSDISIWYAPLFILASVAAVIVSALVDRDARSYYDA